MSNLGLNKHVQKKYAEKTIEGESEVDGNLDIIKELELLNNAYKNILVIIYNNLSDDEKDKVKSFDDLLNIDNISNDNECMNCLKRVLKNFGNCNSFKEFINQQKDISELIKKLQ